MDRLQEDVTILMILCLRDNSCQEYTKKKKKKTQKTKKQNLFGWGKQMHWKIGKRLASHITR